MSIVKTYRAGRILRIGTADRQPGELVPEAHTWHLVDSLLHAGHLHEAFVDAEEFAAAAVVHAPELLADIERHSGVPLTADKPVAPRPQAKKAAPAKD